ncbi:hypothetical protein LX99_04110 [Mucilaginibacter oryzae]|uniref:Uncharacterized protein n=1 Tax=Mucilaginibacter oryzae TaxID=468058 RepID=A0A316HIG5_9SPHI|nr:DUF2683 family protein [Mucilaginibacter oryzae]PWK73725.1 hypothetical protein LX99_04110 [Mucilaginibacter oryzae]
MEAYIVYPSKAQEKVIKAFFEALNIPFEKKEEETLPLHVIEDIAKGQADIEAGRTITFEEFKKRLTISE